MALLQTSAVIDFGHNDDRVTIKLKLDQCPLSTSTADFSVQVIITDLRLNGERYDSGANPPDTVR